MIRVSSNTFRRAAHCGRRFLADTVACPTLVLRYRYEVSYELVFDLI